MKTHLEPSILIKIFKPKTHWETRKRDLCLPVFPHEKAHQGQHGAGRQGAETVEEQQNAEHEAQQGPEERDVHQCLPAPVCRGEEPREPQLGTSPELQKQMGKGDWFRRAQSIIPAPLPSPLPSLLPSLAEPSSPSQALSILSQFYYCLKPHHS